MTGSIPLDMNVQEVGMTSSISHPETILDHLIAAEERRDHLRFGITSQVTLKDTTALAIGLDNGNDALKLGVFSDAGDLVTVRIPMAYAPAEAIQGGESELTYRMGRAAFWIGETALRHDGGDIPAGPASARVVDTRWARVVAASLVELLITAGFAPGVYTLLLGFAIPNNEIVKQRDTSKLGVSDTTADVLKKHVRGQTWTIARTDPKGVTTEWTLQVANVLPQAQSLGTYTVWSKAPTGKTVKAVDGVVVLDIGGGDLQRTEITLDPYQMITRRLGDGTIAIANTLITQFPNLDELNPVAAQQALITRKLMIAGVYRDVSDQVEEAIASDGQNLIGKIVPSLRQSRRFVIVTGGGVILLDRLLKERIAATGKQAGTDYAIINHGLASIVNAVGALFAALFGAQSQRRRT
jgi:hypothetical protein